MNQEVKTVGKSISAYVPMSEHDAALLEKARLNYPHDFEMLAKMAREAESEIAKKEILELERYAWKRYDLCEDFD